MSAAKTFSISISYPPLNSDKGSPFLSQNRQFQWTHTGNVIYPVVPASAASLLRHHAYKVFWDDAVAENLTHSQWLKRITKRQPSLIVLETKTPVIKKHWQLINQLKSLKKTWKPIIVLMGDHVTALPEESLRSSNVDYVITGGDYDYMLLNLANHISKKEKLEPGFWYKNHHRIVNSGKFALRHHCLDDLPLIDRELTKWHLYAYNNSNYKYKPGAYIMSSRDCWWGKCTFCSWTTLYPGSQYRAFSPDYVIKEIENLVDNFGVKEIFDDAGTFPVGPWLEEFCHKIIDKGLNKKVTISCNMRFGALNKKHYELLAKANFRFILYGLESANQETLNQINKNLKKENIVKSLKIAKSVGLQPHVTVMIGYPWETLKQAQNTLNLARTLFREGLADSLQATIVIPYPGTPLFDYCQKNNLLLTQNWDDFDMQNPVMKSPIPPSIQKQLVRDIFKGILSPQFIIRKITSIKSLDDIRFLSTYAVKYFKKLKDFKSS
ncbi:MAG: B12-binding domain-containing radical SAM protein [Patescibacteria group bacterium]|jgi:anaerobic magnesium-protoporphyrin IX monomethyl ester cyclase